MPKSELQSYVAVLGSGIFAVAIYTLAKRQRLSFRYAAGWMLLAIMGIMIGVLRWTVSPISMFLGITQIAVLSSVAVVLLICICVQLSISISGLQSQLRDIAEAIALIDQRHRRNNEENV